MRGAGHFGRAKLGIAALAVALAIALPARKAGAESTPSAGPVATAGVCSFTSFGAKGDGVTDDTGGVQAALASGCGPLIDGENLTYRITKTLTLAKARGLTVANATLIDDVPVEVWERRVLSVSASSDVVLKSLRFDRGSDTTLTNGTENPPNQLRTLFIDKSKSVTIEDVEVWGDGAGTAIYILESDDVRVSRAHIHDMHATAPSVHEMLIGIWPVHSSNITIEAPRVRNLFGKALRLPVESAGISISGSRNLTITDADIAFVNEGIAMSGSRASHDFVVRNSVVSDASNVCYKFTGGAYNGRIEDSLALRCGLFGFSVRGNGARDIVFERDIAVNPGSNGWFVEQKSIYADLISGFSVRRGAEDPTYPRNIAIRDCQSLDDQAVPTMRTGFVTDVDPQAFGIIIQNSRSHGHLNSAIVGFDAAGP